MSDDRQRSDKAVLVVVVAVSLGVLSIYVLAVGPLVWLGENGYISPQHREVVMLPYLPLQYLYDHIGAVRRFLDWYPSWWI